jgi:hypothetical protein
MEPTLNSAVERVDVLNVTFLDLLAALLLFVRPRAGLVFCAAIIVSDVINNSWVRYTH